MRVYIVTKGAYSDYEIAQVCLTRGTAEAFVGARLVAEGERRKDGPITTDWLMSLARHRLADTFTSCYYDIEEFEVLP